MGAESPHEIVGGPVHRDGAQYHLIIELTLGPGRFSLDPRQHWTAKLCDTAAIARRKVLGAAVGLRAERLKRSPSAKDSVRAMGIAGHGRDTSTRFEAGKQAGPDTIEHFLGGGAEGKAAMANWLRGGFEMDRKGNWRLKPQVADTLQRDVQAIMAQTGWERSISRTAQDQNGFSISVKGDIGGGTGSATPRGSAKAAPVGNAFGRAGGSLGISTQESGTTSETASAQLNIVNYDVRQALANAERSASQSQTPAQAFTEELAKAILGPEGIRNRYLGDADSGRGVVDPIAPLTSLEQSTLLDRGRFSTDFSAGPFDGNPDFKKGAD